MSVTTQSTLTNTYQTFFSKKLLDHAVQELRLNEFALEADLPAKSGALTIRFFRPVAADASQVQSLGEGTPITVFRNVTYTPIDVTLEPIGEASKVTDIVDMTGLFDALKQNIQTMGEDCALDADTRTRNVICHQTTGLRKMYAQALASFNAVVGATAANAKLTGADLLRAATSLMISRAKALTGGYVAVLPPQCAYSVKRDSDFLDAAKYSAVQKLYKGEIGTIWGVRCVEATNPFIEANTADTEGTYDAAGEIYSTLVTGRGAYGVPKLAGTAAPGRPKVMIVPPGRAEKADPLAQYGTAGWKALWKSAVLNSDFGRIIRSKTEFVDAA